MSKRPPVFRERLHSEKVWKTIREDIAPVWETPDPKRIDRLRGMIEELEDYHWAADFPDMLQQGRFVDLVDALLRGLCAFSKERREAYKANLAYAAKLQSIIKALSEIEPTEKRTAAIEELKSEHEKAMDGTHWAEWHPMITAEFPTDNWAEWKGRYPDWVGKNLRDALMRVLLVAGYDQAHRTTYFTTKHLNKRAAAQLTRAIAEQYGFKLDRKSSTSG